MDHQSQQEEASPEVQERIRTSFGLQGLMGHLGARITHIAPVAYTSLSRIAPK